MKTDDLVVMLATGAGIAPKHVVARRYTIALGRGMPISFALMLITIGLLSSLALWSALPLLFCWPHYVSPVLAPIGSPYRSCCLFLWSFCGGSLLSL